MNLSHPMQTPMRLLYRLGMRGRRLLPKQRCEAFGASANGVQKIGKLYVINLDRQTDRWFEMEQELKHVKDASGRELTSLVERFSAIDARTFAQPPPSTDDVDPFYTLRDQLFVEPQPHALPDRFELNRPIRMSRQKSLLHAHTSRYGGESPREINRTVLFWKTTPGFVLGSPITLIKHGRSSA